MRLKAGDVVTAQRVGLPLSRFIGRAATPLDEQTRTALAGLVKKAALTQALNEAWGLLALITLAAIAALLFAKRRGSSTRGPSDRGRRRRALPSMGQREEASLCAGRGQGNQ